MISPFIVTYVDFVRRRPPQKEQKRRNDIYVNRKTDFAGQLERCQKILDSRFAVDKLYEATFQILRFTFI